MKIIPLIILLMCSLTTGNAQETRIIIRAKAKDAKFIGSSLGGAHVIVRNSVTGEIMTHGVTEGTTGDTQVIMNQVKKRGDILSTSETAKFEALLNIDEPTLVQIEMRSPMNHRSSQVHVSTEIWAIPGRHILGDGVILEIPGLIVDVLKPRTHEYINLKDVVDQSITVQANVVMMCGCVVDAGGLWDADKMEVKAIVKHNGKRIDDVPLHFVARNLFEAQVPIAKSGNYELIVYGYEAHTGNTGVGKVNYVVLD